MARANGDHQQLFNREEWGKRVGHHRHHELGVDTMHTLPMKKQMNTAPSDRSHGSHGSHELPTPPDMASSPGYLLRRLGQAYQAAWSAHVDSVATGPQVAVLMAIRTYPGVEQGIVGSSVSLDRSTMASIVSRLETRGLIYRVKAAKDGRKRLLYLTKEGQVVVDEVVRRAERLNELLLEGLGPLARDLVVTLMDSLAQRWEALAERDPSVD